VSLQTRIWLDEVEITSWVLAKDHSAGKSQGEALPEWVESSVKGAGFFDWQVKDFAFRLLPGGPVTPQIGQAVRVLIAGTERFSGVVDGIEDATSRTPRLVCQPPAVTLKDTMAGRAGHDARGHARHWFEIQRPGLRIEDACLAVLADYNENRDPRLPPVGAWTVTVGGSVEDPVPIYEPHGLTGPGEGQNSYTPLIISDPGGVPPHLWVGVRLAEDGHLLVGTLNSVGDYYRVAGFRADGPPDNNIIPYASSLPPAMWNALAAAPTISSRLTEETLVAYAREVGDLADDVPMSVEGVVDFPDGTWAVVRATTSESLIGHHLFVTWWGDPRVQAVSGRWANTSMIDLLKLFAMVSGRWLRIVGTEVTLTPRVGGATFVTLPSSNLALEFEQKSGTASPGGSIQVDTLDRSDREDTGLDYGVGRVAALQSYYVDRFAGVSTETRGEWLVDDAPAGLQLLAEDASLGILTELDYSTDGRRFRVLALQEGQ
jgi:hypothetical protein